MTVNWEVLARADALGSKGRLWSLFGPSLCRYLISVIMCTVSVLGTDFIIREPMSLFVSV